MAGESAAEIARRRREKAAHLARQADMFDKGAEGERLTAAALEALPADLWRHVHDVRWPGRRFANIDHVVIGPPGIFVVDSKNWSGNITIQDSVLRQNGRSRESAVAGTADSGLALAELLTAPYASYVRPVLCFVGDRDVSGWVRDVMVCSTGNLVHMLTSRPAVMSPDDVAWVHTMLCTQLQPATGAAAPVRQAPRRATVTRPVPAQRKVKAKPQARAKTRKRSSAKPDVVKLLLALGLAWFLMNHSDVVASVLTGLMQPASDAANATR